MDAEINGIFLLDMYLYFTDHHTIKRLTISNGECITIAGSDEEAGDKIGIGSEAR